MFTRQSTRIFREALSGPTHASASTSIPISISFAGRSRSRVFSSSPLLARYKDSTRRLRNDEIEIETVQRVGSDEKLCPPEALSDIIKSIDRKTHFVELVSPDPPVVRIMCKAEVNLARKAQKEKMRATRMDQKEIQMTWNVGETDLNTKLKKAREQLEKNNMVDVVFAPKAKQRSPSEPEMQEKLQSVVDALQDIAIEKKERTIMRGAGVVSLRPIKVKLPESD